MGIEAALAVGGLGLVGNIIAGKSQEKQAEKQAESIKQSAQIGADTSREFFEAARAELSPYREAGFEALQDIQSLQTPQGEAEFTEQFLSSPMYNQLSEQARQEILRNASATGGLRTGQANVALSSIAPKLTQQALNQRLGGLMNIFSEGVGASRQIAGVAPGVGSQIGSLETQAGIAEGEQQAIASQALPQALATSIGQLGGLAAYYNLSQQPQFATPQLP